MGQAKSKQELDGIGIAQVNKKEIKKNGTQVPEKKMASQDLKLETKNVVETKKELPMIPMEMAAQVVKNEVPDTMRRVEKMELYRPKCTKVNEYLYVAGIQVAQNKDILKECEITHIVNCVDEHIPNYFENSDGEYTAAYCALALRDGASESISDFFYKVIDFIQIARKDRGKVLVHCHEGVSRSCTFVIAYLMWLNKLPYLQVFNEVKTLRGICSPNSGFIGQLLEHEAIVLHPNDYSVPIMYRIAPHSEHDPTLVAKPIFDENSRNFATPTASLVSGRGSYIVLSKNAIHGWTGKDCTFLKEALQQHCLFIQKYNPAMNQAIIVYSVQGEEKDELRQIFPGIVNAGKCEAHYRFKNDFQTSISPCKKDLPQTLPESPTKEDVDKPKLYMMTSESAWEQITNFDMDDLLDDSVFYLVPTDADAKRYIWKGASVSIADDTIKASAHTFMPSKAAAEVIRDGEESDEFWLVYESAY